MTMLLECTWPGICHSVAYIDKWKWHAGSGWVRLRIKKVSSGCLTTCLHLQQQHSDLSDKSWDTLQPGAGLPTLYRLQHQMLQWKLCITLYTAMQGLPHQWKGTICTSSLSPEFSKSKAGIFFTLTASPEQWVEWGKHAGAGSSGEPLTEHLPVL